MMQAIRIHTHGGPEVLSIDSLPEPNPTETQIKIKVHFSALNHMDLWVRKGLPGVPPLPLILGCDAAGEVVEVGADVKNHSVGDRVFIYPMTGVARGEINLNPNFRIYGEHQDGFHAQYICVPSENVLGLPEHVSFEVGAAFPLVTLTAWHMVVTKGNARAGETALLIGASSGVGSAALQILKELGVTVIATAGGSAKVQKTISLGADHVIDHQSESIAQRVKEITKGKGVNLVIEHVGEKVWSDCLRSLAWGGRLVTCGATTGPLVQIDLRHIFIKQQRLLGSTMGTPDEMEAALLWLEQDKIKPVVARIFDYTDVALAHDFLESAQAYGKVLLRWN